MSAPLLQGVRVVDLTDAYGAAAARVYVELGADVVRVECVGRGDVAHRAPRASTGASLYDVMRNVGKQIVELDATSDHDRDTVDALLAGADIVVVSDGWAATLESWRAKSIAERHPHLVTVSITPFGLVGPAAHWASTELVAQAMAGVVYRSGVAELAPVAAPGSYCEDIGAVTAAMAGLLALYQARGDQPGQLLDVSAVMALAQCTDMALPLWSLLGNDQTRIGAGLYPLFACTDGLARIVLPMTPADWRSLIKWLGSPEEWTGPGWEKAMLGVDERAAIVERLPSMFSGRTRDAVTLDGEAAGLRVTPVLTPAEVLVNEHVVARGTFTPVDVDGCSGALMAGVFSIDGERAAIEPLLRRTRAMPDWSRRGSSSTPDDLPAGMALQGVRVLELGSGVASPETGRVLAEWGADVIKVEHRARLDFQRVVMGSDMNPAFATPNRCKRVLGANLAHVDGRALVTRLLPQIDVVLENNATGVLDRLGFGYDRLVAANQRIVLVSSQLYGDRGPWAWRKGYGPSARAVGSLTWLWAHSADSPRGVMSIHPDHFAGRLGAIGALSGLVARERTGHGCRVDIAQFESIAWLLGDLLLAESLDAGAAQPVGNRSSDHAPWGLYRCADDASSESWIAVTVVDDRAWESLLGVAAGAVADEPHWRHEAGRLGDAVRLDDALSAWLRGTVAGAMEVALQAAGVAAAQVLHARLQATHPHFLARDYPVPIAQPGSGPLVLEGASFTGTRAGSPRCGPAPLPGQHSREICHELLGLVDSEIDDLVARGALSDA